MGTFTDVFERKEIKYHLSAAQYDSMVRALQGHMIPDSYGSTRVVSLYLDTPKRLLIERSLDKPLYKEKLRLRSYGAPCEEDRVFVEIKKKFNGIVYKRRVGLSYAAARAYLGGLSYEEACVRYPLPSQEMAAESLGQRSLQIAREIDHFVEAYQPLRASVIIDVVRTAYVSFAKAAQDAKEEVLRAARTGTAIGHVGGVCPVSDSIFALNSDAEPKGDGFIDKMRGKTSAEDDDLRITFDTNISFSDMFTGSTTQPGVFPLIPKDEAIMEVKSAGPFPLWLVEMLDACQAYPSSFSKYGEAYQLIMRKRAHGASSPFSHSAVPTPSPARTRPFRERGATKNEVIQSARRMHALSGVTGGMTVGTLSSSCQISAQVAMQESSECLAVDAHDKQPRNFKTSSCAMKKGGRCA